MVCGGVIFYTELAEFFRIKRIFRIADYADFRLILLGLMDFFVTSFASATCYSEAATCYWFFLGLSAWALTLPRLRDRGLLGDQSLPFVG